MHEPMHDPWHVVSQSPSQLKLPGFAVQLPSQPPVHPPVQLTSADAEHIPVHETERFAWHCAWKLIGVHWTVHPPDVCS